MERKIIHVDMDAFFASVEQRDRPELRGKPVIVGGRPEERGVVAAASYEARKFGVHSAMPTAQALRLCPRAILIPGRMGYYAEISRQIREILYAFTPLVEPLSLDEAFLDVTGSERLFGGAEQIAREIKRRIREEVKLTCSVGIAPNKFLAKLASDLNKPDGFVVVHPSKIVDFLENLPVSRLWGVGPATEERLRARGISTIGDLQQIPRSELIDKFGKWGAQLFELARGIDERPVTSEHEVKSISRETTFAKDLDQFNELRKVLFELADEVAQELREEGLKARTVQIKVRFADFRTITRRVTLKESTDATRVIREAARLLWEHKVALPRQGVRLVGVGVSNLEYPVTGQLRLFAWEDPNAKDSHLLDHVIDEVRSRFQKATHRKEPPTS